MKTQEKAWSAQGAQCLWCKEKGKRGSAQCNSVWMDFQLWSIPDVHRLPFRHP